jgi:hypothetical protein
MTCAYDWAVSATAARATKASLPKSGAQPGSRSPRSRGPARRILAAAAAAPRGYDPGLDPTPDTRAPRRVDRPIVDYTIHGGDTPPIIGRLVANGLHDELTSEAYAVIDAVMGAFTMFVFATLRPWSSSRPSAASSRSGESTSMLIGGSPSQPSRISLSKLKSRRLMLSGSSAGSSRARGSKRHHGQRHLHPTPA